MLRWLHENPYAPLYNHRGCDRLTAEGLQRVKAFEAELKTTPQGWQHAQVPLWLADFAEMCYRDVPFYRRYGAQPANFFDVPSCERSDLSREPWAFVPDSQALTGMIVYQTSGTTGHPLDILTQPEVLAHYLPLLRATLATHEVMLEGKSGRVAIILICFQKSTFTYAAISPFLNQAGFAKINLNPADWRDPADRAKFLDACSPEIYSGDPISFAELAKLPLQTKPKALISTAMTLLPAFRQSLEDHFACPVIDLYSLNESGPIAVAVDEGHVILPHRIYVEILDPDGAPCPPGVRGEVTLSGGFNPFLPLLRYRTGDYASLKFRGTQPVLIGLEGRPPTLFRGTNGQLINNIDVSTVFKDFALTQFALHQSADGALRVRVRGANVDQARLREALLALFGPDQQLSIEELKPLAGDKLIQYTSDDDSV